MTEKRVFSLANDSNIGEYNLNKQ
uniref:Uncharacterized protein n=1 Tax=Anguilla anguilla TaxID=7936 RepID=A0A0E9PDL8_ANGAN